MRPFLSLEIAEPDTSGRFEPLVAYEAKAKADALVKGNDHYLIHDPTIVLESETFVTYGDRLQQLINDSTYKYSLGQIELAGFYDVVERWKSKGGNEIIKEYTDAYQAINKSLILTLTN